MTSCAQDRVITTNELPDKGSKYIETHFPNCIVLQVIEDKAILSTTYEVTLSDNIKLEFNTKSEITGIDGVSKLPDSVIPKNDFRIC